MSLIFCLCLALISFRVAEPRKLRLRTKIVGGNNASIEDFPYQVAVESEHQLICGGSIISEQYILTAAHCLDGVSLKQILIRAGSTFLHTDGKTRTVQNTIAHNKYNEKTSDYDVAILELSEPLNFTSKIQAIALPNGTETPKPGLVGIITGWGHVKEDGAKSKTLQKVGVPIIPQDKCISTYEKDFLITPRMFCAGYLNTGGRDACQGDSGGPFNLNHTLFGITSWGVGCADKNYPGVYLQVAKIREWIFKNTGI